jgi:hypothetical protein
MDKDLKVIIKGVTYRYGILTEEQKALHAKEINKALIQAQKLEIRKNGIVIKPEEVHYIKKGKKG